MTNPQHQRIQDLYLAALEKAPTERLQYVKKKAGGDTELYAELEKLLRIEDGDARLAAPISPLLLTEMFETPESISDYEITGVLGEGGMGIVYNARQRNPARSVALKVLRFDGGEESLKRFKHEAEVLGFLQHPNIAHVYEAGVTSSALGDRPFFSMERVDGTRIDQFASERALSHAQCVELMLGVLDGISHAHQKGIVHRDLKPANLLVQNDGQPKILDFGVARVASLEGEETMITRTGEVVGTLAFMSPEQVAADPSGIDTRADIYALGVVLYRLLSGANPVDVDGVTTIEALRRVTQEEPRPLKQVIPEVDDDLATIVHKALEKEKERRYASADEFTDDLKRFLAREPVLARAPSSLYVAKRFVQRHRGVTFAGALAVIALLGGAIISTSLYLREQGTNRELVQAQTGLQSSNAALEQSNASLQEANQLADERLEAANRRLAELDSSASLIQNLLGDPLPFENGENLLFATVVERSADRVLDGFNEFPMQRTWLAAC